MALASFWWSLILLGERFFPNIYLLVCFYHAYLILLSSWYLLVPCFWCRKCSSDSISSRYIVENWLWTPPYRCRRFRTPGSPKKKMVTPKNIKKVHEIVLVKTLSHFKDIRRKFRLHFHELLSIRKLFWNWVWRLLAVGLNSNVFIILVSFGTV